MSLNYSRQGKHRRLWRLAVATQPTIAENWYKVTYYRCVSIPSGNYMGGGSHVPTAALLRSLQWVSLYRSRSAESAAHTISFFLNLFSSHILLYPCVFLCLFRLCFSREAIASHSFMAYMGVKTCSHKTIYTIKELPKARKA